MREDEVNVGSDFSPESGESSGEILCLSFCHIIPGTANVLTENRIMSAFKFNHIGEQNQKTLNFLRILILKTLFFWKDLRCQSLN